MCVLLSQCPSLFRPFVRLQPFGKGSFAFKSQPLPFPPGSFFLLLPPVLSISETGQRRRHHPQHTAHHGESPQSFSSPRYGHQLVVPPLGGVGVAAERQNVGDTSHVASSLKPKQMNTPQQLILPRTQAQDRNIRFPRIQ